MTPSEELEKLRAEARELRQRTATLERVRDGYRDKSDTLETRNKYLAHKVKELEAAAGELTEEKKALEEKVKVLEARLAGVTLHKDKLLGMIFKQTSKKKELSEYGAERRTLGGQPGHVGHGRKKPVRIDEEKRVYLSHCPHCTTPVTRSALSYERIIEDIVVPAVTKVTRYSIERQWCRRCTKEVRGAPASVLPGFRLGTHSLTLILFLKYRLRLPLERIVESLTAQYGLKIKASTLAHILQRLGEKLTPEYQAIIEEMNQSPIKHADETSWRINGTTGWCWAFLSPQAVAYTIEETRGKGVPDKILGRNPSGVLVRDDYPAYAHLAMEQQSCWAHLLRNSRDAIKQETGSREIKKLHTELTGLYAKLAVIVATPFDEQTRDKKHATFLKKIMVISKRRYRAADARKIQTRIRNQGKNLLTAILHPNVPLTNNAAERQMRPVAVLRKISGGSRSNNGAKAQAVNMSVVQTITLKKQSFFERVSELLTPVNQKFVLERSE